MVRLLIHAAITLIANAIGLLAADYLLEDFDLNASSFLIALLIFTVATVILGPFIMKLALTYASFLMGGIALVTTLVGLLITKAFSDGLEISGLSTWFLATFIIWIASLIAQLILPFILAKLGLGNDSKSTSGPATPPAPVKQ